MPVRKRTPGETFGTIFHEELRTVYKAPSGQLETGKLIATLRQMQTTGIKTVVYSMSWDWGQPKPDQWRVDYVQMLMDCACHNTNLKVNLMLDVVHAPMWILNRELGARSYDADRRNYTLMSWFYPAGNEAARKFIGDVAAYLASNYKGCAVAIQPVYNNEYEAKYTQEYDAFQDYGPYALEKYRVWLQSKGVSLQQYNFRWATKFETWSQVEPPAFYSGNFLGADLSVRYWDWLKFREEAGSEVYNKACQVVQEKGMKCFHHFPEFFTVLDAIYGASMFKSIAASPHTDFLIMDSNFRTPYGTLMNPHKLRLYIAAARSYGKPVHFEAALERFNQLPNMQEGFANAHLAGADGVGITNWHGRVEMNASLATAMRTVPECDADELIGLFLHLDSCSGFRGLQYGRSRVDPLHDFVEDLAVQLSKRCGTDVAVYVELDRFLADLHSFSRAVFVEPLVLYNRTELDLYITIKAALDEVPHQVLHLPFNLTVGPQLVVFQDLVSGSKDAHAT